jgi:tetratricopeptide (TPR) repeat protein
MGLLEDAIREFQDAIALAEPHDGTRRFFQCANLLGHCFLQKGRSNHAITWFGRALEAGDVSDEEQHGLWYEIASAYENSEDHENAAMYYDKIYAENVDFRDVSERVKNLTVNS